MAIICLDNLHAKTIIGTLGRERQTPQDVILSLRIDYDSRKAVKTDDVNDALDYAALTKMIINRVESTKFRLLETLADDVLKLILKQPLVKEAAVKIVKPRALGGERRISLEMTGSKNK